MKNKLILGLIFLLALNSSASGQQDSVTAEHVKTGEKLPDYTLRHLLNYPEQSVNLNQFKGKLLILDFWTFGCSACIASWPKLMKLQNEFNDKIQLILINERENGEEIKAFLEKRNKTLGFKMTLPIAYGDKQIKNLFPHSSVPHLVLIDTNGTVKYITESTYLNSETIKNMLDQKEMNIPEKTDIYYDVKWHKPLYVNGNGGTEESGGKLLFSTMIKEYSPNITTSTRMFGSTDSSSFGVIVNSAFKDMLRILYGQGINLNGMEVRFPGSRISFKIDSGNFVFFLNEIAKPQNRYTIQVTALKKISEEELKKKMVSELEAFFGIRVSQERQMKKSLIITKTDKPLAVYKNGKRKLQISSISMDINNVTLKEVLEHLCATNSVYYNFSYPIVDETNYKGKLGEIKIQTNVNSYHELGKALEKYGLKFSLENREVDVLVITANK